MDIAAQAHLNNGKVDFAETAQNAVRGGAAGILFDLNGGTRDTVKKNLSSNPTLLKQVVNDAEVKYARAAANGEIPSAKILAKDLEDLPIQYTKEVHNYLINKHPDLANRTFIDEMGHIKALQEPDDIISKSARDVQYIRQNSGQNGEMGRVSVKPLQQKNQS